MPGICIVCYTGCKVCLDIFALYGSACIEECVAGTKNIAGVCHVITETVIKFEPELLGTITLQKFGRDFFVQP